MRHVLWLCCVYALVATTAQAINFTAVQRVWDGPNSTGIGSFRPNSELTVTVAANSPDAVITLADRFFLGSPWPPPVAILLNGAQTFDADCDSPHIFYKSGHCAGLLKVKLLGNGQAEIRVPREWLLEAAQEPYLIHKRYETCLATGGETDIFFPSQRCPPVGEFSNRVTVSRPRVAWLLSIQAGHSDILAEFLFLSDSERTRGLAHGPNRTAEWRPDPSHYGELERIYSWVEMGDSSPAEPEQPEPKPTQILTHVFAGPLAKATAETEITITNRTEQPCNASVLFHQGTADAPPVRFNGSYLDSNKLETSIQGGNSQKLTLTRDTGQDLAVGAIFIEAGPECAADSLQVEARYLVTHRDGELMEAFSVLPQTGTDWLSDGDCRILAGDFGSNSDVGLAMVTARPNIRAPADTQLTFEAYDWQANLVQRPPSLEVTGAQHALNPWRFDQPRLVRICLDVPGTENDFQLSLIAIAARTSRRNVQYSSQVLMHPIRPRVQ